jgi:hypothetical protein
MKIQNLQNYYTEFIYRRVIYRIYNSRTAGPISMISDLLDSSPYKNKNNSNLGKNTDNYLDKIIASFSRMTQ